MHTLWCTCNIVDMVTIYMKKDIDDEMKMPDRTRAMWRNANWVMVCVEEKKYWIIILNPIITNTKQE